MFLFRPPAPYSQNCTRYSTISDFKKLRRNNFNIHNECVGFVRCCCWHQLLCMDIFDQLTRYKPDTVLNVWSFRANEFTDDSPQETSLCPLHRFLHFLSAFTSQSGDYKSTSPLAEVKRCRDRLEACVFLYLWCNGFIRRMLFCPQSVTHQWTWT